MLSTAKESPEFVGKLEGRLVSFGRLHPQVARPYARSIAARIDRQESRQSVRETGDRLAEALALLPMFGSLADWWLAFERGMAERIRTAVKPLDLLVLGWIGERHEPRWIPRRADGKVPRGWPPAAGAGELRGQISARVGRIAYLAIVAEGYAVAAVPGPRQWQDWLAAELMHLLEVSSLVPAWTKIRPVQEAVQSFLFFQRGLARDGEPGRLPLDFLLGRWVRAQFSRSWAARRGIEVDEEHVAVMREEVQAWTAEIRARLARIAELAFENPFGKEAGR